MGTGPRAGPSGPAGSWPTSPPTQGALPQPAETFREPAVGCSYIPQPEAQVGCDGLGVASSGAGQTRRLGWGPGSKQRLESGRTWWFRVQKRGGRQTLDSSLTPCDFLPLFNPEGTLPPYV